MDFCCVCCMLSGRSLCDELITRPEESYRLWCVVVFDLETSWMRRLWPTGGCFAAGGEKQPAYSLGCGMNDRWDEFQDFSDSMTFWLKIIKAAFLDIKPRFMAFDDIFLFQSLHFCSHGALSRGRNERFFSRPRRADPFWGPSRFVYKGNFFFFPWNNAAGAIFVRRLRRRVTVPLLPNTPFT